MLHGAHGDDDDAAGQSGTISKAVMVQNKYITCDFVEAFSPTENT